MSDLTPVECDTGGVYLQLRDTYSLGRASALWRTAALACIAGLVFLLYVLLIVVLSVR